MLQEKQYKNLSKISRYANFPIYYNTTEEYYQGGITGWLSNNTMYTTHTVKRNDTLDSLALYYYGNPTYFWVIADFNRIDDCLEQLTEGTKLKIPTFSTIEWE